MCQKSPMTCPKSRITCLLCLSRHPDFVTFPLFPSRLSLTPVPVPLQANEYVEKTLDLESKLTCSMRALQCAKFERVLHPIFEEVSMLCIQTTHIQTTHVCVFVYKQIHTHAWFGMCCSVLRCVAVFCSVLLCATVVCCSVLLCVAVYCNVLQCIAMCCSVLQCVAVYCNVLQRIAMCCSVLQCAAVYCNVLQCIAMCCSVLQCVAMCCSVLQCVAASCKDVSPLC